MPEIDYSKPRVNTILVKLLPEKIEWISREEVVLPDKIKYLSNSYRQILIAKEKNGSGINIITGWILPINNYTDFKIMSGQGKGYPNYEHHINDIIGIYVIPNYIY